MQGENRKLKYSQSAKRSKFMKLAKWLCPNEVIRRNCSAAIHHILQTTMFCNTLYSVAE
jgi:hypothetical protein